MGSASRGPLVLLHTEKRAGRPAIHTIDPYTFKAIAEADARSGGHSSRECVWRISADGRVLAESPPGPLGPIIHRYNGHLFDGTPLHIFNLDDRLVPGPEG